MTVRKRVQPEHYILRFTVEVVELEFLLPCKVRLQDPTEIIPSTPTVYHHGYSVERPFHQPKQLLQEQSLLLPVCLWFRVVKKPTSPKATVFGSESNFFSLSASSVTLKMRGDTHSGCNPKDSRSLRSLCRSSSNGLLLSFSARVSCCNGS